MTTSKDAPVQGTVNFIQHNFPGLDAGEYMVKVSQTVSTQQQTPLSNTYFFAVQGPRFTLNPGDIYATYPPNQAEGEFNNTLPHVVLKTQTLPWIRSATIDTPSREFPDHKHERDVPGWLAVLAFDAEDEKAFPGFRAQAKNGKVRDLFIKRSGNESKRGYSYFFSEKDLSSDSDNAELTKHLDYGQSPDDSCAMIDIPLQLFWKVAPSADDMKMMAHIRNVNITKKATQNGAPASRNDLSKIPGTSNFSLVLGNRLPKPNQRTFAHLVSLEAMAPFLPNDPAASDVPGEIINPTKVAIGSETFEINPEGFVRLVSLTSWSYTSTGDSSHFEQLLKGLQSKNAVSAGADGSNKQRDYSFGLPAKAPDPSDSAATKRAKNALAMGYTALNHETRDGGQTISWYRGPLLPYRVTTNVLPATLASSDAATRYDPDTGMFDISYAAAWQLGRLLALQDKRYSVTLYNWRRDNLRDIVAKMEALLTGQTLDNIQQQLGNHELIYSLLKTFLPDGNGASATGNGLSLAQGRGARAEAHCAVLTDAESIKSVLEEQQSAPFEIYSWLAKLKLLEGVPFSYLVPDERMLPPESLRFFYLDMNWVDALLDGALSIGRYAAKTTPSNEHTHDAAVKPLIVDAAASHARTLRPAALGIPSPVQAKLEAVSGFLLRSDVVRGWPGLEVNGYASDGSPMDIVRFERLAPTVMLCLFEEGGHTLDHVDLHEPAEGLRFGLDGDNSAVNVRYNYTKDNDNGPGRQVVPNVTQPAPFRDSADKRLIRIFRLSKALHDPKYSQYIQGIYEGFDHLPSSEFAMQMVKGVGCVSFKASAV